MGENEIYVGSTAETNLASQVNLIARLFCRRRRSLLSEKSSLRAADTTAFIARLASSFVLQCNASERTEKEEDRKSKRAQPYSIYIVYMSWTAMKLPYHVLYSLMLVLRNKERSRAGILGMNNSPEIIFFHFNAP